MVCIIDENNFVRHDGTLKSTVLTFCLSPLLRLVAEFLDLHSLTDSASKPSQPKKKKIVKDVSDMTEEEQLQAAMMASMGGDASSAIDIPDEEPEDVSTPVEEEGKLVCMQFFMSVSQMWMQDVK
jgi:hypothetical protein